MSITEDFKRQLANAMRVSTDLEILTTWEVDHAEAHNIARNGLPETYVQFPIQGARALEKWESFYLATEREREPGSNCELVVQRRFGHGVYLIHLVRRR